MKIAMYIQALPAIALFAMSGLAYAEANTDPLKSGIGGSSFEQKFGQPKCVVDFSNLGLCKTTESRLSDVWRDVKNISSRYSEAGSISALSSPPAMISGQFKNSEGGRENGEVIEALTNGLKWMAGHIAPNRHAGQARFMSLGNAAEQSVPRMKFDFKIPLYTRTF